MLSLQAVFFFVLSCLRGDVLSRISLLRAFVPSWLLRISSAAPHEHPLPHERPDLKGASIHINRDRPVLIGPEDLRARFPIPIDHLRRGMPEVVRPADAEDRGARSERADEFFRAGGQAPVMGNLDD